MPGAEGPDTMSVPGARGFLLLRRGGGLWGIANAAVDGLARQGAEYRVATGEGALAADEILGVVDSLTVRPVPALIGGSGPRRRRGWRCTAACRWWWSIRGGLPRRAANRRRRAMGWTG